MKGRQRIQQTQTQRMQLTTGLQTSMHILRADAAGLTRYLEEQAAANPLIRLEHAVAVPSDWLPRWTGMTGPAASGGLGHADETASPGPSLMAHVLARIEAAFKPGRQRDIALTLAEALEPSGWLGRTLAAIAAEAGARLAEVEAVLAVLQQIDPPGLFARNLTECLRLQAADSGVLDAVFAVLLDHLDLLAKADIARLAGLAGVDEPEVLRRVRLLRGFNPKPGAGFDGVAAPVREPDLLIERGPQGWQVTLNRSALPAVRLAEGARGPQRTAARAVIQLVENRNATLLFVGQEILRRQIAALDLGPQALCPMTMADVGAAVDLHESTVSRVVAGTSVDTPHGTWWLKRLFSAAMGGDVSAAALRERLARLIAAEDRAAPLSDAALATALSEGETRVARRTVAKYRAMLAIPPAHLRRVRRVPARRAMSGLAATGRVADGAAPARPLA